MRKLRAMKLWFSDLKYNGVKLRQWYNWHHRIFWTGLIICAPSMLAMLYESFFGTLQGSWRLLLIEETDLSNTMTGNLLFPVCVITMVVYVRELILPFRFFCPHCDEAMPSNSAWTCPHCQQAHPDPNKPWFILENSFLGHCKNPACRRSPANVTCIHCKQPIPLTVQPLKVPAHAPQPRSAKVARWNSAKSVYEIDGVPVTPQNGGTQNGRIHVRLEDGQEGWIDAHQFDPNTMVRI